MARIYKGYSAAEVYGDLLKDLIYSPQYKVTPRGQKTHEIEDCVLEIKNPLWNLFSNKRRSSPTKYIGAELLWYFSGDANIKFISKYASMWESLQNPDETANSAYGKLIFNTENEHGFTPYQWALQSLIRDKDTRQAFIRFNSPKHQTFETKDQVCTMHGNFHIRDNALNFSIIMRSNDSVLGLMTDIAFFSILHQQMFLHLSSGELYPNLRIGSYTHYSHSMHLYERNFELVEEMLNYPFKEDAMPVLSKNILGMDGHVLPEYGNLTEIDHLTDNNFINWCLEKAQLVEALPIK